MNDLDREIRHRLGALLDDAPMPQSYKAATARNSAPPSPSTGFRLAIGLSAAGLLVAAAAVAFWPASETEQVIAAPSESAVAPDVLNRLEFGGSAVTGLPGADREQRLLTVLGDDLLLASSFGPPGAGEVEVVALRSENRGATETILSADVTGSVAALETFGDQIVVVTTGHIADEAPTVFVSNDAGASWARTLLPTPPDATQAQLAAAGGAAVGEDTIAIAGYQGVWSQSGTEWVYAAVADEGHLNSIHWEGSEFVLVGGLPDPNDERNELPALWRSPNATSWTLQTTPGVDPEMRTPDGAGPVIANHQENWVSITTARRADGQPAGTYVLAGTVATDETQANWVQDWAFRSAVPTPWGFLASATRTDASEPPVLLGSVDGANWFDLDEAAPGDFDAGVFWDDSYIVAGSNSGTSQRVVWVIPTDQDIDLVYVEPPSDVEVDLDSSFPDWFDVTTASPILAAAGASEIEAIGAYFETLAPGRPPATLVQSTTPPQGFVEVIDDFRIELANSTVSYRWRDNGDTISGTIYLRPNENGWDVVAIETYGVAVESLAIQDGVLSATVTNQFSDRSFADVFDTTGQPVPASPNPDGYVSRGAETPYGTAAGEGGSRLDFDLEVPDQPLRLRVYLVGGSLFAPTELIINN